MSGRKIALIALIFAVLLGSGTAGITKKGLMEIPPYSFTFFRFFIASLFVLPFFLHSKGHKTSNLKELIPTSLFATGNVLFFILGVSLTTANVGSLIYAAVPLLIAVILYVLYRHRFSRQKECGLIIGFLGVLLITVLPLVEKGQAFAGNIGGNLLLTVAIISWSFYMVFSKRLHEKYSPFLITSNFIFLSTVVLFPFFLWDLYTKFGWWHDLSGWGIFSILYVAIIITVINYILNQYVIKHGGTVMAATMFYIMPIFGFIINFFLLGELLTTGFIMGSLLALVGTYLVVRK